MKKIKNTNTQPSLFDGSPEGEEIKATITAAEYEKDVESIADATAKIYDKALSDMDTVEIQIRVLIAQGVLDDTIIPLIDAAQDAMVAAAVPLSRLGAALRKAQEAYHKDAKRQAAVARSYVRDRERQDKINAGEDVKIYADGAWDEFLEEFVGLPMSDPDFDLTEVL